MGKFQTKTNGNATPSTPKAKGDGFIVDARPSEKGCVSLYGLGQRFPVSLYPKALLAILARADDLKAWMEENREQLNWGDDNDAAKPPAEGRTRIG